MLGKTAGTKHVIIYFIVLSYVLHFVLINVMTLQLGRVVTIVAYHLAAWSPNIAALLVLGCIVKDKSSIRQLFAGWTKWRVNVRWYVIALLPLVVGSISGGIYYLANGTAPTFPSSVLSVFTGLLMSILTGATGEELGWRGFALPRLQSKYGALSSSILIGVVWAGWHIPYWPIPGWFPKMQTIPFIAFTLQAIAKSVIMTWLYNETGGSVLLASLFHLVLNYSLFLGLLPSAPLPTEPIIIGTITWIVFAVMAGKKLVPTDRLSS